ncbi:hypothetical protein ACH5RR_022813 [Cinchona calisaya]|uniref:Uncharacterized protein n=1 Tax=Cinchona calisaya TaxID=153742 RepID=A0ABD2Z8U7_9GENT
MPPRKDKRKQVLISHEETHSDQELERNQDRVEEPYNLNEEDEEDVEMNILIWGILGDAKKAAQRQHEWEARRANPQQRYDPEKADKWLTEVEEFLEML